MVEEKRGEKDLDDDGVGGAAFWEPRYEASFEKLENADAEEDELFVYFVDGRKEGEGQEEEEPEDVEPVEGGAFAIEHFEWGLRGSI
jgi:hypothetical protein